MKLVRDKIPEIIRAGGAHPEVTIALGVELKEALESKVREELEELAEEPSLEEAADLLEAYLALITHLGFTLEEVEVERRRKAKERGGFGGGVMLWNVYPG